MELLGTLGLDNVSADPNAIPDGKYDGDVFQSEYVLKKDGSLAHAITYKTSEGGAQKSQWYTLYTNCVDANGQPATSVAEVAGGTPAMSDNQKRWYKKLWVDLLDIAEEEVKNQKPENLVGVPVTFGLKTKNGWQNINFVERRETNVQAGPVTFGSPTSGTVPFDAGVQPPSF